MNRKERRRQSKAGGHGDPSSGGFGASDALALLQSKRTAPPTPPSAAAEQTAPSEAAITIRVQYRVLDLLRGGGTVVDAAVAARETAEEVWAALRPAVEARKQPGFACASGCAWCCYQQVSVAPPEAVAIADYVRGNFSPADLAALKARLADLDAKSRGRGPRGRAELKAACAFLDGGKCTVYPVRPLRCRGVYSRDAAHCRWAMENPAQIFGSRDVHGRPGPYPVEPATVMDATLTGLARALADRRLAWQALELTAAVRIALDTPDPARRYLAGEPVFDGAELPDRDG